MGFLERQVPLLVHTGISGFPSGRLGPDRERGRMGAQSVPRRQKESEALVHDPSDGYHYIDIDDSEEVIRAIQASRSCAPHPGRSGACSLIDRPCHEECMNVRSRSSSPLRNVRGHIDLLRL